MSTSRVTETRLYGDITEPYPRFITSTEVSQLGRMLFAHGVFNSKRLYICSSARQTRTMCSSCVTFGTRGG